MDSFIPLALITVATPAQATNKRAFALQLQGPFNAYVRTGSHLYPLSGPPFWRLLVLFKVFHNLNLQHYKINGGFVKG